VMAKKKNKPMKAVVSLPLSEAILADCECGEKVVFPDHSRCQACERARGQADMRALFKKELGTFALLLGWP